MTSRTAMILVGVVIVGVGLAAGTWFLTDEPLVPDDVLLATFANMASIHAYTQEVATETEIAGRLLRIEGIYHIDRRTMRFASSATTTLDIPESNERHVFNVANIAIGDNVYVKIETADETLQDRIPHSPEWKHFLRDQIPESYTDIAATGPILDNMLLFQESGSYVRLAEKHGEAKWGDDTLVHYSFELADGIPQNLGGTLQTLLDRIEDGTVDIWVDAARAEVRHMVISRPQYHSTTTFSNINHIPGIDPPFASRN